MPVRRALKVIARPLKRPLEALFMLEADIAAAWASGAHRRLHRANWQIAPTPEYYNHRLDLYWQWRANRNSSWLERGVFSMVAIKPEAKVLELCCGDGFNAYHFYSKRAGEVIAVDFDPHAIAAAKRYYALPQLRYEVADIRTDIPAGDFDNVVWDTAIAHFTEQEIATIMPAIKARLAQRGGVLSGNTIVERIDGSKQLDQHEYEFKSKDDLARFLKPHFKNVTVFETFFPGRHNLYFWASDGVVPFRKDWEEIREIGEP
jgi:SAM-dependent methyltransferase